MKKTILAILGIMSLAGAAVAGPHYYGGNGYYRGGGYNCGPRYYSAPVYCAPRVVYYRSAPVCYPRVYRAPVCGPRIYIGPIAFGWR